MLNLSFLNSHLNVRNLIYFKKIFHLFLFLRVKHVKPSKCQKRKKRKRGLKPIGLIYKYIENYQNEKKKKKLLIYSKCSD